MTLWNARPGILLRLYDYKIDQTVLTEAVGHMSNISALWTGITRDTLSNIKILYVLIDRVCLGFPQCEMVFISM